MLIVFYLCFRLFSFCNTLHSYTIDHFSKNNAMRFKFLFFIFYLTFFQLFGQKHQTYDPDGDSFGFLWFYYAEAGTYKKEVPISPENYPHISIKAPEVNKKETIHIILKVTDKGSLQLSRYKRIIVNILPKSIHQMH